MNVGAIKRLGEQHPEVLEMLAEWQSLSKQHDGMVVALLRKELAECDRNHTRADARLVDESKRLAAILEQNCKTVADMRNQLKLFENVFEQVKFHCKENRRRIVELESDAEDPKVEVSNAG
jgi:hypothetical protein